MNPNSNSILFSKRILFIGFIFLSISVLAIPYLLHADKKMQKVYHEMIKGANAKQGSGGKVPQQAHQRYHDTNKELWFISQGQRLHLLLYSKDSYLTLDRHLTAGNNLIESMTQMNCYMQEELYFILPDGKEAKQDLAGKWHLRGSNETISVQNITMKPMQVIRYLDAEKATYCYQTDLFQAENVTITRYIAPGHRLDQNTLKEKKELLMSGFANYVEFSLSAENLNFSAHQLKATVHRM